MFNVFNVFYKFGLLILDENRYSQKTFKIKKKRKTHQLFQKFENIGTEITAAAREEEEVQTQFSDS